MADLLNAWISKDVIEEKDLHFDRTGMTVTFRTVGWEEQLKLRKELTVGTKDKVIAASEEEAQSLIIATSMKRIKKGAEEQEVNLRNMDTLKSMGVTSEKAALNKMFRAGEIAEIMKFINSLSDGKTTVEELKN